MIRLHLLIIFLLLIQRSNAQCDSTVFRNTGTFIHDVSLIDSNKIIGVGDNGYIIKSMDGGRHWNNIQSYTIFPLQAVQMLPDGVGYAVGTYKNVLKTEDEGDTWFPLYVKSETNFPNIYDIYHDLFFLNRDTGFIVADQGAVLSTKDGGKAWKNTLLGTGNLESVTFINDSLGFICGNTNEIYRTVNRGESWTKTAVNGFIYAQALKKIRFINDTTGFAIGTNDLIVRTSDAGITWTVIDVPRGNNYYNDIYFFSPLKGIVIGNQVGGAMLQTSDGGITWQVKFDLPARYTSYYSIDADKNKQKVIIVGGGGSDPLGNNGRTILSTIDGGLSYNDISRNGRIEYKDIFFLNDSSGYIGGDEGLVYKTTDNGETWKPLQYVPSLISSNPVRRLFFLDSITGFAASDLLYKTLDGGQNWMKMTTPGEALQFNAMTIFFFNNAEGLVQDGAFIYKTSDGGTTWNMVLRSTTFFRNFCVTPDGRCFAVGSGGSIFRSGDKGNTWTKVDLHTNEYLVSAYFYNDQIGFIGTSDSTLFKTTNGGNTWERINTGIKYLELTAFRFLSPLVGYTIANNNGGLTLIYKTNDGGSSWFIVQRENENIRMSGFNNLYFAGQRGLIVKTDRLVKPGIPGYINGPDKSCINSKSNFFVGDMVNTGFRWSLDGGGINTFINNKDTVLWNMIGTHTLSVTAFNVCGTSAPRETTTNVILFEPIITRTDSILTATEGVSYQWYRNNLVIPASQGGTSKTIKPVIPASYTVNVTSAYGCTVATPAYDFVVTLPLKLLGFTGALNNDGTVDFNWITSNASRTKLFRLERVAADGRYIAVDSTPALNNTFIQQYYRGKDINPSSGLNYYRLCIVDIDGEINYSSVIVIDVTRKNKKQVQVYPNPVTSNTIVVAKGTENILKVTIYDLSTRILKTYYNSSNEELFKINVGWLRNGTYFIQIQEERSVRTEKVIVNK